MSFLYFIILIGVLIFVHELGHFLVAKLFKVKVLRFSIGFGPKIISYHYGETEYTLCALPLGGFVQMLGAELESIEELPEEDKARALMSKPIWQRSLVVLAGPAFNLILPVFIYFIFGMAQTTAAPAVIGEVFLDTPASEAGLQPGDRVVSIDNRPVTYWHQLVNGVSNSYDKVVHLEYERDGEIHAVDFTPEKKTSTDFLGLAQRTYGMLGIQQGTYGTTVALSDREGAAARGGLHFFDRILTINGETVQRFDEILGHVRHSKGAPLEIVALRRVPIDVSYGTFYHQRVVQLTITPVEVDGTFRAGIEPAETYVSQVEAGSPAAKAGLMPGDKVVALDGQSYNSWLLVVQRIHNTINQQIVDRDVAGDTERELKPEFELRYVRAGQEHTTTLAPDVLSFHDDNKQQRYRIIIGWGSMRDTVFPDQIPFPFFGRMIYSADQAVSQTADFVRMMLVGFVRLAQGRVAVESIGGPIMIGELAAQAGRAGWEPFLQMMALISINLAIINLLPIPVLDGGHLLLFALEAIKRGPLSFRTRQIAAYIGFTLIIFLMIFAFKNDIERNWHRVVEYFEEA